MVMGGTMGRWVDGIFSVAVRCGAAVQYQWIDGGAESRDADEDAAEGGGGGGGCEGEGEGEGEGVGASASGQMLLGTCPFLFYPRPLVSSSHWAVGSLLRALLWSSDALSQSAPASRWLHKRETVIGPPAEPLLTTHRTLCTCTDDSDDSDDPDDGNPPPSLLQECLFSFSPGPIS